jgi:hypothetical protein
LVRAFFVAALSLLTISVPRGDYCALVYQTESQRL